MTEPTNSTEPTDSSTLSESQKSPNPQKPQLLREIKTWVELNPSCSPKVDPDAVIASHVRVPVMVLNHHEYNDNRGLGWNHVLDIAPDNPEVKVHHYVTLPVHHGVLSGFTLDYAVRSWPE